MDSVKSKQEALALLAPGSHSLAICNVLLPDGRGTDVVDKANQLGIRAILITGHPREIQALTVRRIAHLTKPFSLEQLENAIEASLSPESVSLRQR